MSSDSSASDSSSSDSSTSDSSDSDGSDSSDSKSSENFDCNANLYVNKDILNVYWNAGEYDASSNVNALVNVRYELADPHDSSIDADSGLLTFGDDGERVTVTVTCVDHPDCSRSFDVNIIKVIFQKSDGSSLDDPARVGITANNHDRTQHWRALVIPLEAVTLVNLNGDDGAHVVVSNQQINTEGDTYISFDIVGQIASDGPDYQYDAWVEADIDDADGATEPAIQYVKVVIPSAIGDRDTQWGPQAFDGDNAILTATTSPRAFPDPPRGMVELVTLYGPVLKIPVVDQFGGDIGDIYYGAIIEEQMIDDEGNPGAIVNINRSLLSDSSYGDPVKYEARHYAPDGSRWWPVDSDEANGWTTSNIKEDMPSTVSEPNKVRVYVDGYELKPSPAIQNRLTTTIAPNVVEITWPEIE